MGPTNIKETLIEMADQRTFSIVASILPGPSLDYVDANFIWTTFQNSVPTSLKKFSIINSNRLMQYKYE